VYGLIRPPAQPLPEIDLDAFKVCFYQRWRVGELLFTNLVIAFGMSSPSNLQHDLTSGVLMRFIPHAPQRRGITDLLAFLIILVAARRPGIHRYPGIPSILDAILRDATRYFILMFVCQLFVELFLLLAPVGGICHVTGGWSCCANPACYMFRRKFSSCPGCKFSSSLTLK